MSIKDRQDRIIELRNQGKSYGEICKEIGENKSYVAYVCKRSTDDKNKTYNREFEKLKFEQDVCDAIKQCNNINQVCKILHLDAQTNNYKRIRAIIKKYNLDISHFLIDYQERKKAKTYTKDEIFVENSPVVQTYKIRNYLFKFDLKDKICECCGGVEWMGKEIPLQVHHINGNHMDNRIENLQILCPNCHAQTETYCGKNRSQTEIRKNYKDYGYCQVCGKPLTAGQSKYCSIECKFADSKINNISKEELIRCFIEYNSFESVGKHFNISGKAIVKWCKKLGIPEKKKELKEYINKYIMDESGAEGIPSK